MALPNKYHRLLVATQRFNSISHFTDIVTVTLFILTAIATANKLLAKKIVESEFFDWSWNAIGICGFIFFILFSSQLSELNRRRQLTEFEIEATLKAERRRRPRKRR
ncbi:hypothetical protein [Bdellovibrio sp. HCB337]|uniref:hypothetical protein n=1 Tax=Bdellovibrio sp. HCB337 TaxID=3394358 RepID=UPI0039A74527